MNGIYLLLGSNLGDKRENIRQALRRLEYQVKIAGQSPIYETAAWGETDQPSFLNNVIEIKTGLSPYELIRETQSIEIDMGRERNERWAPRIIDIDLLYYYDSIINDQKLTIPHPQIQFRRFTLAPLVDLVPYGYHPKLKKTQLQLLEECTDNLQVKKLM